MGDRSDVPPRITQPLETTVRPPGRREPTTELVLMATRDRMGVERVARGLVGQAVVRQIEDLRALSQAMARTSSRRPHLVIDCCLPAIDVEAMARRLPPLPEGSRVVLWGVTTARLSEVARAEPRAREWIPCASDATHEDLVALLRGLF